MKNFLIILLFPFCALPVAAQTVAADSARIDSLVRTLPEVMVSGERPVVRVEGSALVYDVGRMPGSATADNAYEALKTLPGVIETGGSLTLPGGNADTRRTRHKPDAGAARPAVEEHA